MRAACSCSVSCSRSSFPPAPTFSSACCPALCGLLSRPAVNSRLRGIRPGVGAVGGRLQGAKHTGVQGLDWDVSAGERPKSFIHDTIDQYWILGTGPTLDDGVAQGGSRCDAAFRPNVKRWDYMQSQCDGMRRHSHRTIQTFTRTFTWRNVASKRSTIPKLSLCERSVTHPVSRYDAQYFGSKP